jgi:TRAP-type mannitol/chloroaromatic compound transport system permease small subunit
MAEEHNLTDEMIAGRRGDATQLPSDMPHWMSGTIRSIEALSRLVGWIVAWFIVVIMGSMIYEVVARYLFMAPTIWAYDISRMFCGAAFVLGGGYALARGVHIRSDFLYRNWSVKAQGRVDALLYLVFFFPTMLLLLWVSGEWAWRSVAMGERGIDTALAPLLGPVKSSLPIGILFLTIQGISELLKSVYAASHGRWPNA